MEAYISMISAFGCNFVIEGWGACNGAILPISQNQALFSLLGDNFGGDARVTYGLPNLVGARPSARGRGLDSASSRWAAMAAWSKWF
jgi:microcystin-dependent protein